jgi:YD repeat-containing protein
MFATGAVYTFEWDSLNLLVEANFNRAKQTGVQNNGILTDVNIVTFDKFKNSFG